MAGHQHEATAVRNRETSCAVSHQNIKGLVNKLERFSMVNNLGFNNDGKTVNNIQGTNLHQVKKGTVYFKILHQNIRGLGNKAGELLSHLHPDSLQVLCLTEHHLNHVQLENLHNGNYKLLVSAHYCRQQHEKGGVAIFVHNSLVFSNINIEQTVQIKIQKYAQLNSHLVPQTCVF